jgi:hypothetical protein
MKGGTEMLKRQRKKRLKREIGRIRTSIDYSNGKDLTAIGRYRIKSGVVYIINIKLVEEGRN